MEKIVHLHNRYRSDLAQGKLSGFKTAERMPTLKWNTELANLAAMHVKLCTINHDQCHNTDDFVFSGQNIGTKFNNCIKLVQLTCNSFS